MSTQHDRDYITVIKADTAIGKTAKLAGNGEIIFITDGAGICGMARTEYVPDGKAMLALLSGLDDNEYITPDFVPDAVQKGVSFGVVTQAQYTKLTGLKKGDPDFGRLVSVDGGKTHFIALSMAPGAWVHGSWRLFDRDIYPTTPAQYKCTLSEWEDMVERIVPGFKASERVVVPSSKGRVCLAGRPETAAQSQNMHVWVHCTNVDVTERTHSSAKVAAANAGLLWYTPRIDKSTGNPLPGAGNPATLFDLSVFNIHRNVYACPPKVGAGLELLPPNGMVIEGQLLDMETAFPAVPAGRVEVLSTAQEPATADARGRVTIVNTSASGNATVLEMEDGSVLTLEAFVASTAYVTGEKYRCQTPFRESSSWNGVVRKTSGDSVMIHDNGTGVTFWTRLPVWQPAARAYRAARVEHTEADGSVLTANEQVKSETEKRLGMALSRIPYGHLKLLVPEIKKQSGLTSVDAMKALSSIGDVAYRQTPEFQRQQTRKAEQTKAEAKTRESRGRRELTTLSDYDDALHELHHHWWLVLGSEKVTAGTFFTDPTTTHNLLEMREYSIPAIKHFLTPANLGEGNDSVSPVETWMKSPERRGVRKVTFEPGMTKMPQGVLNLWIGWGLQTAASSAGCELFLKHVYEAWASGDAKIYHYLLGWMATVVQRIYFREPGKPMRRTEVALVARSGQGTGKGLVGAYYGRLFGQHAMSTSRGDGLAARFNWSFANKIFIQADEAFFAGDHKTHNVLKAFLTDPTFDVEAKFRDAVTLPNYASLLMTSNKSWVTPADVEDRRMCVFDVSDLHKGDRAYFKALADEMENGGPAALFRYLLDMDLEGFDITDFPRTAALGEQVENTLSRDEGVFEWLGDALDRGEFRVPDSWLGRHIKVSNSSQTEVWQKVDQIMLWPEKSELALPVQLLTDCIAEFCRGRKFVAVSSKAIGKQLVKAGLADGTERKGYYRTKTTSQWETAQELRVRFWHLPDLESAREVMNDYLLRSGGQKRAET